jgi:AraC-like DNA-binding protein
VASLTETLEREIAAKEPAYAFHCTAAFMQIIGYLSRCYSQAQPPSLQPLLRMGSVIGYLEEHYASPVALAELARVAHMSRSSLQRFFKRSTGSSPVAYLIRLRVRKACELLRSGDQTVTEIAFRVGFTDSNYFARQFSRVMGESPRDYRRRTALPRK